MFYLMVLAITGTVLGAAGGMLFGGSEGLILGASTGICVGVMVWTVAGMVERLNAERRLERYFRNESLD